MIRFHLHGIVREEESGIGIEGLFVKAYDKDLLFDDLLGTAFTGPDGSFDIYTEAADFRDLFERRPDLYLKIYSSDGATLLFDTKDAVRWNAGRYETFDVRIPRARLGDRAPKRGIELLGDSGEARTSFQAGESLTLNVRGLRPSTPHQVVVADDEGELFTDSLITNARGEIEPTVIWPLLGIEDPRGNARVRVEDAHAKWRGRKLRLAIRDGKNAVGEATIDIEQELSRPLVVATDDEGFVRHGFVIGDGDARIGLYAFPQWEAARVFMVPRQHEWRPGDRIDPVELEGGRLAVTDVGFAGGAAQQVTVANARELRPGAYDFIVRRVRYGYEDDDDLVVRADDVIGGRRVTGLVVREEFMASKVIRGGCTNIMQIAGRYLGINPYMNYTDVFQVGESVYGALDPGALDPAHIGKMVALYVVPHKTAAQWTMSAHLDHLAVLGGNANTQKFLTQSWCTNANLRLLWPNATAVGEYDVVADFGNNTGDAMSFLADDTYNMPLDIIDGYINTGFRIVPDPTTDTSFANAGTFTYNEGTEGSLAVAEDGGWNVPLRAVVYFPADVPGATTVAQVSMSQANYPIVVAVHGQSSIQTGYLGYNYLLDHLAKNGFICASVYCSDGMLAVGRARVLQRHLQILFSRFGSRVANNVGIMGHSRGGEAVMHAAKLNHNEAWGYNLNAVISLAPTDWILGDSLVGAWAPPVFVLYGSLDGDVAGIQDTGFELYDRASGMKKSMSFVYGACHDRFNTEWGDTDLTAPWSKLGPMDVARVIPPAAHQAIAKGYMAAFYRQTLQNQPQWQGIFKGEWVPAAVQASTPNLKIYTQYEDTTVRTVDDFEGAHSAASWASSTIGDMVTQTGLPALPQENSLFALDTQSPHSTAGLRLRWDNLTDVLQWNIPAGQRDVHNFAALAFRITQVVGSGSNPANQAQDLRVTLTDGGGMSRAIRVSKFAEVPYPDVRQLSSYTKSALRTIRIPLTAYTILCLNIQQVNLTDVVSVRFEFFEKPAGEIEIDSIQFTN